MDLKGKKINFLGDSITEGYGVEREEDFFVNRMKRDYSLAASRNYGIGGTRYARQKHPNFDEPIDRDFCMRLYEMDPDADIVVVFGGTNDFGHGDAEFGSPSDRTPETFYGACHYVYSHLKERYPSAVIVVLTPLHRTTEMLHRGDGSKTWDCPLLSEYVDVIRNVAGEYGLPVLDLYNDSYLDTRVNEVLWRYIPDGLHPNGEGHKILEEEIASFLMKL